MNKYLISPFLSHKNNVVKENRPSVKYFGEDLRTRLQREENKRRNELKTWAATSFSFK